MTNTLTQLASRLKVGVTPQALPIPGTNQVENSAGGYSFPVNDWTRLQRFLILGSEGGSYYASEQKLSADNANGVLNCIQNDGPRVVREIVAVSKAGRAPKNDPALFALALCASLGDIETRRLALDALPEVARTGTHLFHFAAFCDGARGWGRGLRRAVGRWYETMGAEKLAYQALKYQSRDGWSHRDLLRLSHPKPGSQAHGILYHWMTQGWPGVGDEPHDVEALRQIWAFERAKRAGTEDEIVGLIRDYKLPREGIPTQFLTSPKVWEALLEDMPLAAMVRNLATMTKIELLTRTSDATKRVVSMLNDSDRIRRARLHPIALLSALTTYSSGRGVKGNATWTAVPKVIDALDSAFYTAFGALEPTNKRWALALDVSGSMGGPPIAGVAGLTPRVASAAMAMVTNAVEDDVQMLAFSHELRTLSLSRKQRLDDVLKAVDKIPMGATDCALPMLWASKTKAKVDVFVVYTDSETWFGNIHPVEALRRYREESGIAAKLIVVGMVANKFSIADPNDAGMLDVVGFDTAAPQLMSDFSLNNM
ncbi:60 kDa SS-A/Ro ribonucleoprotein [Abditibacteriota bacterium]|nr:60 kDa SS-A/Ro ribonucleoprotein [Abditibacteriota bacterium]